MNIKDTLTQLIQFPTVTNNPQENKRALDWCVEQIRDLPLSIEHHLFNNFPSVTITTKQTRTPKLWFLAHMDVVPAHEELFIPRQEGTLLYGRGAYDMKFAIACYVQLLKDLGKTLPEYDFGVMLTSDEETGGKYGVGKLIEQGYTSEICIAPDGGEDWQIEVRAKGIWQIAFTSTGQVAHGSRPWKGKNAIEDLAAFLLKLKKYFKRGNSREGFKRTMNTGVFHGGVIVNSIPDTAYAHVDIRFTSSRELHSIKKIVAQLMRHHPDITLTEMSQADVYTNDIHNHAIASFVNLIPEEKRPLHGVSSHGSSDAHYFALRSIPTIVTRPRGGDLHSDTEWIDLDDLEIFYDVLKQYVIKTTKNNPSAIL